MKQDRPPLRDGKPKAGRFLPLLSRLCAEVVEFDFGGRRMAAIRQEDWAAAAQNDEARPLRDHVAGRLFIADGVYVLFAPSSAKPETPGQSVAQRLTQRELMVGSMIADGLTDKEIARKLGISSHTVREHCRRACAKLGITKRSALVRCLFSSQVREAE